MTDHGRGGWTVPPPRCCPLPALALLPAVVGAAAGLIPGRRLGAGGQFAAASRSPRRSTPLLLAHRPSAGLASPVARPARLGASAWPGWWVGRCSAHASSGETWLGVAWPARPSGGFWRCRARSTNLLGGLLLLQLLGLKRPCACWPSPSPMPPWLARVVSDPSRCLCHRPLQALPASRRRPGRRTPCLTALEPALAFARRPSG